MKKRNVVLLLGILCTASVFSACGSNQADKAAKESEVIEKEGKSSEGEDGEKEEELPEEPEEEAVKVGILLPDMEAQEAKDWELLSVKFAEAGYAPEILSAEGDAQTQTEQFETLVEEEAEAIVVNPVDAYGLTEALAVAEEKGVPVFSYDSLIMDTNYSKYYTTFDTRAAGNLVGETIVKAKELQKAREEKRIVTIEFLMGTPEKVSELFFYNGILEPLQEFFDDGTLVCKSGYVNFDDTAVMRESAESAVNRFRDILTEYYGENEAPDIICTASDAYTYGIAELLEGMGKVPGSENWPLITGRGSEAAAVKNVAEGKMGFTLFYDRSKLVDTCLKMVDSYLSGDPAKVDNYSQYDNGKRIVGAYTCNAELIDKDNYQILVDNGTYSAEEIMPQLPSPTPTPEETAPENAAGEAVGENVEEADGEGAEAADEVEEDKASTEAATSVKEA